MSATQFAPEPESLDLGTAQEYFVDGMAYYEEIDGLARSGYYSVQRDGTRIICLKIVCTVATRASMIEAVAKVTALRLAS